MSELAKKAVSVACSAALMGAVVPAAAVSVAGECALETAYAADAASVANGTWGTCAWDLDSNGVLTIHEGEGAAVSGYGPWYDYRTKVTSIKTDGTVVLPSRCDFLFRYLSNLKSVDMNGFDTTNVTNMQYMFDNCSTLQSLDMSMFDTSHVTDMGSMFCDCSKLESLNVSSFDTSRVTNMSSMFCRCARLSELDLSSFDTLYVKSMSNMFNGCTNLSDLNIMSFNTAKVTSMYSMFTGCGSLEKLDVSTLDTSNVTDMSAMFSGCSRLTTLALSGFDTSKAMNLSSMFKNCSSLKSINVSSFDTAKVQHFGSMFYGCSSLTSIDLSRFDTISIWSSSFESMFEACSSLKSVNVSSFDTSKCTSFASMFRGCRSLSSLDLSNFDTSRATSMDSMFGGCTSLASLTLGDKFTFNGAGESRLTGSNLPVGDWTSSADGQAYSYNAIPNNVAAIYTRPVEVAPPEEEPITETEKTPQEQVAEAAKEAATKDVGEKVQVGNETYTVTVDPLTEVKAITATVKVGKSTFELTVTAKGKLYACYVPPASQTTAKVLAKQPKTLTRGGVSFPNNSYLVTAKMKGMEKGFLKKNPQMTSVIVKSKRLNAKNVKGCFKGSKVKKVTVRVAGGTSKKAVTVNKTWAKKYKKIFKKKNSGLKVTVTS